MTIYKTGDRSPWDYIQPWDTALFGEQIQDAEVRQNWARAFAIAGGLPYIWNELARPISEICYGLLELRAGDKVLVIGEGIAPAGWDQDMQQLVGPSGHVQAIEIIHEGRSRTVGLQRGRKGVAGTWQWDYTFKTPSDHYDAVAIMQSTQHCDDWAETATELVRVLKPGRRIVLAEAVLVGANLRSRLNADVHLDQWYDKLIGSREIPYTSPEELLEAFHGKLESPRAMDWHGIEMFWGRKPPRGQ
jgi:SAM-dependent methyltransferase